MCILHETHWLSGELDDSEIERCSSFFETSACNHQIVRERTLPEPLGERALDRQEILAHIRAFLEEDPQYLSSYSWLRDRAGVALDDDTHDEPRGRGTKRAAALMMEDDAVVGEEQAVVGGGGESGDGYEAPVFGEQKAQSVERWAKKRMLTPPETP